MQFRLQFGHHVIDLLHGSDLYVETTKWAFHLCFNLKVNSWRPTWLRWGDGAGQVEFLAWRLVYNGIDRGFYGKHAQG